MDVKKNPFVEEWNGRREITEESAEFNARTVPIMLFTCAIFPYACFKMISNEAKSRPEIRQRGIDII